VLSRREHSHASTAEWEELQGLQRPPWLNRKQSTQRRFDDLRVLAAAARRFQRRLISCLGSFGFGFDLGFYGDGSLRGSGDRFWLVLTSSWSVRWRRQEFARRQWELMRRRRLNTAAAAWSWQLGHGREGLWYHDKVRVWNVPWTRYDFMLI
jgi:hypothetical protein